MVYHPPVHDHIQLQSFGLTHIKAENAGASFETSEAIFKCNYGCTSSVAYQLLVLLRQKKEKPPPLKYFLMTLYFLKTYAEVFQYMGLFGIKSDKTARVWTWRVLEDLSDICDDLVRMPRLSDLPAGVDFFCTGDGVHFSTNECRIDPDRPFVSESQSHKTKKAALSYTIYTSLFESKIIRFDGPYEAGTGDATIFKEGMMAAMPLGKVMICDKGYRDKGINQYVSCPNSCDDEETKAFKDRASARQEHVNERMKEFKVLAGKFTHNHQRKYKHMLCFKSCLALIQLSIAAERPLIPIAPFH